MGLRSGVAGEIVVVAPSEGLVGGVFNPGGGINGGASTFKGLPDASPSNEGGVVPGVGKDFMAIGSSEGRLPYGDLRRRSSCRLFARGRTPPALPPRANSETERLKGLIKRSIHRPPESKERGPDLPSASSTTGRVRIASSICREGGRSSAGGGRRSSNCTEVGGEGGEADCSLLLPARLRSLIVKECWKCVQHMTLHREDSSHL